MLYYFMLENIALFKEAWQENPYKYQYSWFILTYGAELAVDGRYSNLSAYGKQCAISEDKSSTAEWRVDLGTVHSIHSIHLQYRTDNLLWGNFCFFQKKINLYELISPLFFFSKKKTCLNVYQIN